MTTSKSYKEELFANLSNKKYREAFVASHISNGISFQIMALRNQRGWNQEKLAKISKKKQETICRLENPNYGSFTLATLKEIASAFNVALVVRFVSFGELVEWDFKLSSDSLKALSFDEDPYFKTKKEEIAVTTEQYTPTPRKGILDSEVSLQKILDNFVVTENSSLPRFPVMPTAVAS